MKKMYIEPEMNIVTVDAASALLNGSGAATPDPISGPVIVNDIGLTDSYESTSLGDAL